MILTNGRVAALAIGLPLMLATVAWSGFSVVGTLARASEHHAARYSWHGGEISVHTTSGSIRIEPGAGRHIEVAYTEHYGLRKPTVTATETGHGLQLTARCTGGLLANNCSTNYTVTVPALARLDLHSGDGGVQLTGTSGAATIDTGDGGVSLDNVSGDITAHTGDGGITGTQVRSRMVQASTGDGGIGIDWQVAPVTVVATTGDGGIDLVVPAGSGPYRTSTSTGDGGVTVTVPTSAAATAAITARSGDGGITIAPAG